MMKDRFQNLMNRFKTMVGGKPRGYAQLDALDQPLNAGYDYGEPGGASEGHGVADVRGRGAAGAEREPGAGGTGC